MSARTRAIRTDCYQGHKIVKATHAKWANKAVEHAVAHMQVDQYGASHCEVYDEKVGTLHAP